jgi:hypothetical protein
MMRLAAPSAEVSHRPDLSSPRYAAPIGKEAELKAIDEHLAALVGPAPPFSKARLASARPDARGCRRPRGGRRPHGRSTSPLTRSYEASSSCSLPASSLGVTGL